MGEPDDTFTPLPTLTESLMPDDELRLEDALADAVVVSVSDPPPVPLGRAPAYDFLDGRMLPGSAGGPLMTRGRETLKTRVEKCLRTRRGESPAVDPDFGLDIVAEDLLSEGEPFDPSAVAEYLAAVERGVLALDRVSAIDDLSIDGAADMDSVLISFTVVVDDDPEPLTFTRLDLGV